MIASTMISYHADTDLIDIVSSEEATRPNITASIDNDVTFTPGDTNKASR